ncbi:MAG: hypothetical protein AYP45_08170 [Candidatus Brocadia carolinensis]|uniref:ATPase domain-containing protein n=1 Tax=Candidatus Brocadia carolinensis TaxID=1004156 RepID=A0A1V4ATV6_9BACT|nr:MAG: hypothetical protein AYP45_08170 [Candidatus Brocadia caroliniensis]
MPPIKDTSLSDIHLSKDIAELEEDVRLVWEPPDIYDEVFKDNVWLIYGRKGSGKSHLVDYLGKEKSKKEGKDSVIIIRPREDKLFPSVMSAITAVEDTDERIIIENVTSMLEFVVVALLMRRCIDLKGFLCFNTDRETIYNFLVDNGFHEGSVLHKIVGVLSRITDGYFKIVDNLVQLLADNPLTKGFPGAKAALWRSLMQARTSFLICIDDIDEIGFSFSKSDRFFANALIVLMLRLNLEFAKAKHRLRVLLTSPSELFFHSSLWGDDWVEAKSRCLRWTHHEGIQRIVNKRIGKLLNIKKTNPRDENDIYSDATEQTWQRLFPQNITNKLNKQELALKYLLRHTFYTPRQVLDLCDKILHHQGDKGATIETARNIKDCEWSNAFQTEVEEYSCNIVSNFLKLYGKIYDGLDDVCRAFTSKPAVWTRGNLISFVERNELSITRRETQERYSGDAIIDKLQQLGFIGLGTKDLLSPSMTTAFNMRFAFLERLPNSRPWEVGVISPIFYDSYGILPPDRTVIVPHEKLSLSNQAWQEVAQYRP